MITLAQDAAEVRRLLGGPLPQRPSFDDIVSALIGSIQHMNNLAGASGRGWSEGSASLTSVVDQADYAITPAAGATFGRALFVYRDLGNNVYLPVPFTDYTTELTNQKYEFWLSTADAGEYPYYSGEKIAFHRVGGLPRLRIYPIPEDVRTYVIKYATGAIDWSTFEWTDVPPFPEFSHYRQLRAALKTVRLCEWEGYSRQDNQTYRNEMRADLEKQFAEQEMEFRPFLRNPQGGSTISEVGYFWE